MLIASLLASVIGLLALLWVMWKPNRSPDAMVLVGLPVAYVLLGMCSVFLSGAVLTMIVGVIGAIVWHRTGRVKAAIAPVLLGALVAGHLVPYLLWVAPDMKRYAQVREQLLVLNPDDRLQRPAKPAIESVQLTRNVERL